MDEKDSFWIEEDFYHKEDKKTDRKERKFASQRDRSKYKKTDQDKRKKEIPIASEHEFKGRVLGITPDGILVEFQQKEYLCSLKGVLKKEMERVKNLVIVGDFVRFSTLDDYQGLITFVEPRTSILSRADNLSRNKEQLIAANVDCALIVTSVCAPALKPPLIDRYIIAAQKGNIQPVVVINKIDLLLENTHSPLVQQEQSLLKELESIYKEIHIPLFLVSTFTKEGLDSLKHFLERKMSVFSGQSGVGKSSLINELYDKTLKTGDITTKTNKGSHTTTSARLFPLASGGYCIDTPGIKSFGLWDLEVKDIQKYYTEIAEASKKCKFKDCTHLNEPDCYVKMLIEKGKISSLRFASYSGLITSFKDTHHKR